MRALPASVVAELRTYEEHASRFRQGLEVGSRVGELAGALEQGAYAMLRAAKALRAAANPEVDRAT